MGMNIRWKASIARCIVERMQLEFGRPMLVNNSSNMEQSCDERTNNIIKKVSRVENSTGMRNIL